MKHQQVSSFSEGIERRLVKFYLVASLAIAVMTLLWFEGWNLVEQVNYKITIALHPSTSRSVSDFGKVASTPLHNHGPEVLLDEIENMASRNVSTNDIVDEIMLQHLVRPSMRLTVSVSVHKHDAQALELEARRLAERHFSVGEIVEHLIMECET